jgi:uncharacterized membrane protein YraQ (UPF0718 family)
MIKEYLTKHKWDIAAIAGFAAFIIITYIVDLEFGKTVENNFIDFFLEMAGFIPCMFILVGLFDVWVPKESIQKHIGEESGIQGIILVILLAMLQAGPLYGAFPVAYILYRKGCSVRNIFIYLGAFSTLKIPMLGFEIGFLGLKFSLLRTIITLPVFILIAAIMAAYVKNRQFEVKDPGIVEKQDAGQSGENNKVAPHKR